MQTYLGFMGNTKRTPATTLPLVDNTAAGLGLWFCSKTRTYHRAR